MTFSGRPQRNHSSIFVVLTLYRAVFFVSGSRLLKKMRVMMTLDLPEGAQSGI